MAYADVTETADGSKVHWSLPFSYLLREFVRVAVTDPAGNVTTPGFTFVDASTIRIIPAIPAGFKVRRYRSTKLSEPMVDYQNKAVITEGDLDTSNTQAVHLAQEFNDKLEDVSRVTLDAVGDAEALLAEARREIERVASLPSDMQRVEAELARIAAIANDIDLGPVREAIASNTAAIAGKFDKTGGDVSGDVAIDGSLQVHGPSQFVQGATAATPQATASGTEVVTAAWVLANKQAPIPGTYLPLTGGTLTGNLHIGEDNHNNGIASRGLYVAGTVEATQFELERYGKTLSFSPRTRDSEYHPMVSLNHAAIFSGAGQSLSIGVAGGAAMTITNAGTVRVYCTMQCVAPGSGSNTNEVPTTEWVRALVAAEIATHTAQTHTV